MLLGDLALTLAAMFTGAAIYINVAEHPARLQLDDEAMLAEWKPSYKRGAMMQASLAMIGAVVGVLAYLTSTDVRWLLGALLLFSNWPFTLIFIMPTNNALMAMSRQRAGPESRRLLGRWARLHAVRSALGGLSTLTFLWASN